MRTCDPKRGLHILDSAAQLFSQHHYHEVRMDDIACHAGVAKGTLYRYYRDKEDLYLALTVHGMHRLFEESQGKIVGAGDPEQKLYDFIAHIIRFYEQYPYFLDLIQRIESSNSTASLNALNTIRSQFYHLLISLITQIERDGQPATRHPDLAALSLMGMIRSLLRFTVQPWPHHLARWVYHQFMNGLGGTSLDRETDESIPEVRFRPDVVPAETAQT